MTVHEETEPKTSKDYKRMVDPFKGADDRSSALQLTTTLALFFGFWILAWLSLDVSYLLTLLLGIPAAGFLVRLFMIQHDCGHGSYFKSKKLRDSVGFFLGCLTLTPYHYWKTTHAYHHSHSGDLDFRGFGDIKTWTVKEYQSRTKGQRLYYRLYRNPLILFGIGPTYQFVIKHRFPWDIPQKWRKLWKDVWLTNLAVAILVAVAGYFTGYAEFFLVQAPITFMSSTFGLYLFYVQHQYEETYWHDHENWDYFDAAIYGSSHLVLPKWLQWMTASIGIHHVHHLSSQIPNYKLQACLEANPDLQKATQITIPETWPLMNLTLWDEESERMIRFSDLRKGNYGKKLLDAEKAAAAAQAPVASVVDADDKSEVEEPALV